MPRSWTTREMATDGQALWDSVAAAFNRRRRFFEALPEALICAGHLYATGLQARPARFSLSR